MVDLPCELVRIQDILMEKGFVLKVAMRICCDNKLAIYIVQNLVLHARIQQLK